MSGRYYDIAQRKAQKLGRQIEVPNRPIPELCECCGKKRKLHSDHCQNTGRFRGWCCQGCTNRATLMDSPERLNKRIVYLNRPLQPEPICWARPGGFVYIWTDKKYNKKYVGSHWGTEDDGYVCGSITIRREYCDRPHDFSREIVARVTTHLADLRVEEQRWLDKIPPKEFGRSYYNIKQS